MVERVDLGEEVDLLGELDLTRLQVIDIVADGGDLPPDSPIAQRRSLAAIAAAEKPRRTQFV